MLRFPKTRPVSNKFHKFLELTAKRFIKDNRLVICFSQQPELTLPVNI